MNKEILKKLNDTRKELDISKEDFVNLLAVIIKYQKECTNYISDEQLGLLMESILLNTDILETNYKGFKTLKKSINQTIKKGIECFDNKK